MSATTIASSRTATGTMVDNTPEETYPIPVKATCKNSRCGAIIGEFYNSWIQVSNSYFLPAISYRIMGLKTSGKAKPAQGSALKGWWVDLLICFTLHLSYDNLIIIFCVYFKLQMFTDLFFAFHNLNYQIFFLQNSIFRRLLFICLKFLSGFVLPTGRHLSGAGPGASVAAFSPPPTPG